MMPVYKYGQSNTHIDFAFLYLCSLNERSVAHFKWMSCCPLLKEYSFSQFSIFIRRSLWHIIIIKIINKRNQKWQERNTSTRTKNISVFYSFLKMTLRKYLSKPCNCFSLGCFPWSCINTSFSRRTHYLRNGFITQVLTLEQSCRNLAVNKTFKICDRQNRA